MKKRTTPPKTHELKCLSKYFSAKWNGRKNWEIRRNDRLFMVGDFLLEKEYYPGSDTYSGAEILEEVIDIMSEKKFGLRKDFIIMSTKIIQVRRRSDGPWWLAPEFKNDYREFNPSLIKC